MVSIVDLILSCVYLVRSLAPQENPPDLISKFRA